MPPPVDSRTMSAEASVTVANSPVAHVAPIRQRRADVDALRVVSAVMVVTIHITSSFMPEPGTYPNSPATWLSDITNMASRCAVPTFFAVSGWAFLVGTPPSDEASWLLRRIRRLIVPLLAWSIAYVGSAWVTAQANGWQLGRPGHIPKDWLLQEATSALAGPGTGPQLWFLYYLIPMTLVLWLVRAAPHSISDRRTRIAVWCAAAGLIIPFGLAGTLYGSVSWVPFGWALGYGILGYVVLSTAPPRWASVALFLGATAALVVTEQMYGYDQWEMSYAGPLVFAETVGLIGLVRSLHISDRWRGVVAGLAGLTFGVYLVHALFVQGFMLTLYRWQIPPMVMLVVSWSATVLVSFALVALWHRIRALEWLLG
jgi:surface polysaccharide O-acyltransferase-like enzyme